MSIAVLSSALAGWVLKLFNQNVLPTLVLARQKGQAGRFSWVVSRRFHDANPMRLALIVFTF